MMTREQVKRSFKHFFSGTCLSRVSGLMRDVSMAWAFGTGTQVAAFMVAYRLAHLCRRLLGEGPFQNAFIPLYEEKRLVSQGEAAAFFCSTKVVQTLFLLFLIALGALFIGSLLYFGDFSPSNSEILRYTLYLLPSLLFICLYGLNAALLQSHGHSFLAAAAPIAFNIAWVVGAMSVAEYAEEEKVGWLAPFVVVGCALQWLITLPVCYSLIKGHWKAINLQLWASAQSLLVPLSLCLLGAGATQINSALDVLFARYAESEGPAYLWYALRIQQLPLAVWGAAMANALLPALSRARRSGNNAFYAQILDEGLKYTALAMIGAAILLSFSSELLPKKLFGYGGFNAESIAGTAECFRGYLLGLPAMSMILIAAPAFYAVGDYRYPMVASLWAIATNIALNTFFIFGLHWGAASVAYATSISSYVNLLLLLRGTSYLKEPKEQKDKSGLVNYSFVP